jgi:reactive intermediate/imine deaminase
MKLVESKNAPAAIGPYSQAWISGNLVFTSGQLPVNPEDGKMPTDITEQCVQSCKNVMAILEEAGTDMSRVIKTTCYLADIADFTAFNQAYSNYFTNKPARSCFAVKDLPKGALCEIEAIAEI